MILELQGVTLRFGGVVALNDVRMNVESDEILALIGPNGAGKSCILNCISGFNVPQEGEIRFNGQLLREQPSHTRSKNGIGRTFQGDKLIAELSVEDNVLVGRHAHMKTNVFQDFFYWPYSHKAKNQHKTEVDRILSLLDLQKYKKIAVSELSYGLRKKVDLARALATAPRILLMDEPMAGMNSAEKEVMARLVTQIHREFKIPVLIIEHDIEIVMNIADRITVLDWGRVVATGTPAEIQKNPEVIAAYLGQEDQ
ncbi:MAG: ABC transporter ATP-binding protein [Burkholderiaceae bacterium]|nr:ABC transporter ATP-binding protein [Burkholderiaceae bacterium]MEB2317862.1 ABC transporter ATP-binding protein [Pseudomonadota bacterium]